MKTCKLCFREFDEETVLHGSPPAELADVFLEGMEMEEINDLCPECREESGVINLLGFGQ